MRNLESKGPFIKRLGIYQKERFPIVLHSILIGAFSFSAVSYSRICRGQSDFVDLPVFIAGFITVFNLFFLLRILDEFKDKKEDAMYRKDLPVPRGLISLRELGFLGVFIFLFNVAIILIFLPQLLLIYSGIITYLLLMSKEFFIGPWLKTHQLFYVTSHMFIIPFIDIYASGMDWRMEGVSPPPGLLFFFAVSYMNGIVLELGRKIKIKEDESVGVITYTSLLGVRKAILLWGGSLVTTLLLAICATEYANFGIWPYFIFSTLFIICLVPGLLFLCKPTRSRAKWIEYTSGFWSILMYLSLGGIPMLKNLLFL